MTRDEALHLLLREPAQVGRWCSYPLLTDALQGRWLRSLIGGTEDRTLMAHRGSYKTTCLSLAIAVLMLIRPSANILFFRKTTAGAEEIVRQVGRLLCCDALRFISAALWGAPVVPVRQTANELTLSNRCSTRGASQLTGLGIGTSITGRHAELIFTDDIVNLKDRVSAAERQRTAAAFMELQNIRTPGGRIVNTGTPWHPEDAFRLMPEAERWDCYRTGLLTAEQLERLRASMSPSLFAANYELRHIAAEDTLFPAVAAWTDDASLLSDGIAHIDAGYGGGDFSAMTLAARTADGIVMLGRLRHQHIDDCLEAFLAEAEALRCAPVWCETNGDKGYLGREMRRRGAEVRLYREGQNKFTKIATHLRGCWPEITFLRGTDPEFLRQILGYTADAAHDDAPDSAACACRILMKRE